MLRPLQLPDDFSGKLWLTSMPGRYEPLEEFLGWCRADWVEEIVCLVDSEEIAHKSPQYGVALRTKGMPLSVEQFPIPDYGVPENIEGLVDLARRVSEKLQAGRKIVLHCAAGYGRTGTFAVMVLMVAGMPLEIALATVKSAGSSPETSEQRQLLQRLSI